uniref:Transcription elongation factor A N-terminal and central domain containing n=1 Tax=Electrophorus electricus TaxID=8005 RepID=A0A4W4GI14_ELEEL
MEYMDLQEITRYATRIEKLHKDGNYEDISSLLTDLCNTTVVLSQLQNTAIVQTLCQLVKSCPVAAVRKTAKDLLSKWKQHPHTGNILEPDNVNQELTSQASGFSVASGHYNGEEDSGSTNLRAKCVELLLRALTPDQEADVEATTQLSTLAHTIEKHIHALHSQNQLKYKSCVRSKLANLKNPKSPHLRQGLLTGALPPEVFARMSSKEMAGEELQQLREGYTAAGISEHQLPCGPGGMRTTKVRCRRCEAMDCTVTQVCRGTNTDEEVVTFVTCAGCGEQWYHSRWVCL